MSKEFKSIEDITCVEECYQVAEWPKAEKIEDIPSELHEAILNWYENVVMAKAANTLTTPGKKADWRNHSQDKYFPYFRLLPSGGVDFFDASSYDAYAFSGDASRLAYLDRSGARHMAQLNPKAFEDYLTK
jgi:hypothetical protein